VTRSESKGGRNVSHSIMLHHFHGAAHPMRQGSISSKQFEKLLQWLMSKYRLLSAGEYQEKAILGLLDPSDVCLSFDDALLCQYDVAVPLLKKYRLQAFFFVYSSPMMGQPDQLEIYSYFRSVKYASVDQFYEEFLQETKRLLGVRLVEFRQRFLELDYLKERSFYSDNDRWFRFLRDNVLQKDQYDLIMKTLMTHKDFCARSIYDALWLNDGHLHNLVDQGHVLGLHSTTHPTVMACLSSEQQREEYKNNLDHLTSILGSHGEIKTMSHPCGRYNEDTLSILRGLGIEIGFRSNMTHVERRTLLELPREDHTNIVRKLRI